MKRLFVLLFAIIPAVIAEADTLSIVSPHWEGIRYEMGRAFAEDYKAQTGRDVAITWLDLGGTSEILRSIRSQFKSTPDTIGIDLLFGGGVDPFVTLKQEGLLQHPAVSLENHPDAATEVAGVPLHDQDGMFFAPVMSVFGIVCNRKVLRQLRISEPKSWEDLGRPELKGWIGTSDPRRSGSTHAAYEIMLQAYGWERGWKIIQAIGANARAFVTNSIQVSKDVSNGEVACGLSIDSQAWSQIRTYGADKISFVMPEALSVVSGDGVAMLKGAPNAETAQAFINFLLSERAQKIWMFAQGSPGGPEHYELARLSIMPKLYADRASAVTVNPFELRSALKYNSTLGTSRWALVNDLLGTFVVDPHSRVGESSSAGAPISESQAQELIANQKKMTPLEHAELLHSWEVSLYEGNRWKLLLKAFPSALLALFLILAAARRIVRR